MEAKCNHIRSIVIRNQVEKLLQKHWHPICFILVICSTNNNGWYFYSAFLSKLWIQSAYNGPFIHAMGGRAANIRRQHPHIPGLPTPTLGSASCPRTLRHVDSKINVFIYHNIFLATPFGLWAGVYCLLENCFVPRHSIQQILTAHIKQFDSKVRNLKVKRNTFINYDLHLFLDHYCM